MRITLAQINPTVGDIDGNLDLICKAVENSPPSDLVIFPELALTGCHPRDLLEAPWFLDDISRAREILRTFSKGLPETGILVGTPIPSGQKTGKGLYNAAELIYRGRALIEQPKSILSTHDVSDESRYFDHPPGLRTVPFRGEVLGISICEDAWNLPGLWEQRYYSVDPVSILAKQGATLLINLAASPFSLDKEEKRFRVMGEQARRHNLPFVFVNLVGGNDELIFDGGSFLLDREGEPVAVLPSFREEVETVDTGEKGDSSRYNRGDRMDKLSRALILGIADYAKKGGFKKAVVGLSGGIDSAVTVSLAVRALGPDNVLSIAMPSPFSSPESLGLARELAENLSIRLLEIPITPVFHSYLDTLKEFIGGEEDTAVLARENIQARIRGNILMAFSNRFGHLVISTGNKSEAATGYCTLYGDLAGGLAAISDVPKTMVYKLAEYFNREKTVIPPGIISRAPSAELKKGQTDQDVLPPYPVLDRIVKAYVEDRSSAPEIIEQNIDPRTVYRTIRMINESEYKRRQAPPGLKVTGKAFGSGRRMPLSTRHISPGKR